MIIVTVDTDLRQSFSIVVTVTVVILYIYKHIASSNLGHRKFNCFGGNSFEEWKDFVLLCKVKDKRNFDRILVSFMGQ